MSTKRKRDAIESELIKRIRKKGLVNPEKKGRPVVLLEGSSFLVMYDGGLTPLTQLDLRTLCAFSVDVHGDGVSDDAGANRIATNRALDTENLKSDEFCAFAKALKICIDAEARKKLGVETALAALVG